MTCGHSDCDKPHCVQGNACGNSCISPNKTCHIDAEAAALQLQPQPQSAASCSSAIEFELQVLKTMLAACSTDNDTPETAEIRKTLGVESLADTCQCPCAKRIVEIEKTINAFKAFLDKKSGGEFAAAAVLLPQAAESPSSSSEPSSAASGNADADSDAEAESLDALLKRLTEENATQKAKIVSLESQLQTIVQEETEKPVIVETMTTSPPAAEAAAAAAIPLEDVLRPSAEQLMPALPAVVPPAAEASGFSGSGVVIEEVTADLPLSIQAPEFVEAYNKATAAIEAAPPADSPNASAEAKRQIKNPVTTAVNLFKKLQDSTVGHTPEQWQNEDINYKPANTLTSWIMSSTAPRVPADLVRRTIAFLYAPFMVNNATMPSGDFSEISNALAAIAQRPASELDKSRADVLEQIQAFSCKAFASYLNPDAEERNRAEFWRYMLHFYGEKVFANCDNAAFSTSSGKSVGEEYTRLRERLVLP